MGYKSIVHKTPEQIKAENKIKTLVKGVSEKAVNTFWSRIAHMQDPNDIDDILRIKNQVINEI